ncbi:MAG: DUF2723 domain-containing protein [Elusimicrobia bacterium]|nr:DUF2723 domain-containing protein [Elusimicrobiota bacterium]
MLVVAHSLSVAHPPSYPLYTLVGKIFAQIPLGNLAFRLNILSALAGAAAVAMLFYILSLHLGKLPAFLSAACLGILPTFCHVSQVSEMYSLHLLFALILLHLAWPREKSLPDNRFLLFCFLYGLFLGNRLDLILWAPAYGSLIWRTGGEGLSSFRIRRPPILFGFFFFLLGFSVYLYLPLRSAQAPWLDWNHPALLKNFIGSLSRKSYGATLDLLSKQYQTGELFLPNLIENAKHILQGIGWIGIFLCLFGFFHLMRSERDLWMSTLLGYFFSGPLFLYLANMPPNPHSMAIVEPHYLFSDIFPLLWMAYGIYILAQRTRWLTLPCMIQLLLLLLSHAPHSNRRWNLLAHDYARNLLAAAPSESLLLVREDVQLFSLWHQQQVLGKRPEIPILAQGLSGSPWYQKNFTRQYPIPQPVLLKTNDTSSWRKAKDLFALRMFATHDAELPPKIPALPYGLAVEIFPSIKSIPPPWTFYIFRGKHRYEHQSDFFASDLVEAYAQGWYRQASLKNLGDSSESVAIRKELNLAWSIKEDIPEIPLSLGVLESNRGRWPMAQHYFQRTCETYEVLEHLTQKYHSLPSLKEAIRTASANAYLNLGVALEKKGENSEAERMYEEALRKNPALAQAHYNRAILYWNQDWNKVMGELQEALRIDPGHAPARAALLQVERRGK